MCVSRVLFAVSVELLHFVLFVCSFIFLTLYFLQLFDQSDTECLLSQFISAQCVCGNVKDTYIMFYNFHQMLEMKMYPQ